MSSDSSGQGLMSLVSLLHEHWSFESDSSVGGVGSLWAILQSFGWKGTTGVTNALKALDWSIPISDALIVGTPGGNFGGLP